MNSPKIYIAGHRGVVGSEVLRRFRARLLVNSQYIARESVQVIKALREELADIRDVLMDSGHVTYRQI